MHKEKDLILLVGGGGMAGIFSAGVLETFQDADLYSRIHSVYAVSSGADAAAYFLAKQSRDISNFFLNYLTEPGFIKNRPFRFALQAFIHAINPAYRVEDVVNTHYVVEIAQRSAIKLHADEFEKNGIPFFVKVFSVDTLTHRYLSTETDLFKKLQATSSGSPLSHEPIEINGERFIDGDSIDSCIDEELLKKFSSKTIIKIENHPLKNDFSVSSWCLQQLAIGLFYSFYGADMAKRYQTGLQDKKSKNISSGDNVIIIKADTTCSIVSVDRTLLKTLYEEGRQKGLTVLKKIKFPSKKLFNQ